MRGRLAWGVGANLYGQGVTALAQLCTVPAFLHAWGSDGLGLWITISAWTSLLSLADGGIMAAGGTAMIMAMGRGDVATAVLMFRGVMRLVLTVAAGLAIVLGGLGSLWPVGMSEAVLAPSDARIAALALGLAALASLPLGTLELGFRANADYATGVVATSSVRLAENLAALAVACSGHGLAGAALVILAVRGVGALALYLWLRGRATWIASLAEGRASPVLRPLLRPALAALAVPVGLALSLQGTTVAAGFTVPAAAVATFVAARTLTRALVQALGLFNHALMPEVSRAAGCGDARRSAALLRLNLVVALGLLVPGWLALVAVGPALMARWTAGLLRPDPVFFAVMATAALVHGGWLSVSNLLLAANRQAEYAYRFAGVAAATSLLAAILGHGVGLRGLAVASLVGELGMAVLVVPGQIRAAIQPPLLAAAGRP